MKIKNSATIYYYFFYFFIFYPIFYYLNYLQKDNIKNFYTKHKIVYINIHIIPYFDTTLANDF